MSLCYRSHKMGTFNSQSSWRLGDRGFFSPSTSNPACYFRTPSPLQCC